MVIFLVILLFLAHWNKNNSSNKKKRSKSKSISDHNNNNQNEILDFSSIKKFEESESTMHKDSSVPDLYGSLPIHKDVEESPEVKSKDKKQNRFINVRNEDEESKFSDENRSTLPLHSDSFKKNDRKNENCIFTQAKYETVDYRNKNEASLCSPNFMGVGNLSSSNPFMPWDSKQKSLEFETSPRELFQNPVESLRSVISNFVEKNGKLKLTEIINSIFPQKTRDFCSQTNTGKNELIKMQLTEQENSELRLQVKRWMESNSKLKEKYETFWEKSSSLEMALRERDSSIYSMRLETDALATELKNAKLLEDHMKNEIDNAKAKREEIEEKLKEIKLIRGQDTILIRKLKAEIDAKKKEIIEASELTNRVTLELEEIRKENKEIKRNMESYENERFNFVSKIKKLEREIYKLTTENNKRMWSAFDIK